MSQPQTFAPNILRRGTSSEGNLEPPRGYTPFIPGKDAQADTHVNSNRPPTIRGTFTPQKPRQQDGKGKQWKPSAMISDFDPFPVNPVSDVQLPPNEVKNKEGGKGKKNKNAAKNAPINANPTKEVVKQEANIQPKVVAATTTVTGGNKKNKNKAADSSKVEAKSVDTKPVDIKDVKDTKKGKKGKDAQQQQPISTSNTTTVNATTVNKKKKGKNAPAAPRTLLGEALPPATMPAFEVDVAELPVDPRYFGQLLPARRRLVVTGVTFDCEATIEALLLPVRYCVASLHWHQGALWLMLEQDASEDLVLQHLETLPGKPNVEYCLSALAPQMGSEEAALVTKQQALEKLLSCEDQSFVQFQESFHADSTQEAAAPGSVHSVGNLRAVPVASAAVLASKEGKKTPALSSTATARNLLLQSSQLDKGMMAMVRNTPQGQHRGFGLGLGVGAVDVSSMRLPILDELVKHEKKTNKARANKKQQQVAAKK